MKNLNIENDYIRKLNNFMIDEIKDIKNIKILEFENRKGYHKIISIYAKLIMKLILLMLKIIQNQLMIY